MTQPTKWSAPLGSGADVQELPDDDLKYASFSKIFPQITQVPLSAGGVAPRRIDFNSLFKLLADNIYYYQNGGVFEYSDTADYEKGAIVRYNDNIYLCIQDNSALNKHAPTDAEYWKKIALNSDLANYLPIAGGNVTDNLTIQDKNIDVIEEQGNGYIRYSSGLQICWSEIEVNNYLNNLQENYWNLPLSFKDSMYSVSIVAKDGSIDKIFGIGRGSTSTTVVLACRDLSGSTSQFTVLASVIAIGRWK